MRWFDYGRFEIRCGFNLISFQFKLFLTQRVEANDFAKIEDSTRPHLSSLRNTRVTFKPEQNSDRGFEPQ